MNNTMPNGGDSTSTEPNTTLVRTFHVRRDDDPDELAHNIMVLLEQEGMVLDLSRYDRRADVIELRIADQAQRSEP
jgi:hypothetical protein